MELKKRLDRIRQGFEKQAPPEVLAVFHRVTEDLRSSGMMNRVLKEAQPAPAFDLDSSSGNRISSSGILERGPLVLTFFRGHW